MRTIQNSLTVHDEPFLERLYLSVMEQVERAYGAKSGGYRLTELNAYFRRQLLQIRDALRALRGEVELVVAAKVYTLAFSQCGVVDVELSLGEAKRELVAIREMERMKARRFFGGSCYCRTTHGAISPGAFEIRATKDKQSALWLRCAIVEVS
tara:strand:- start:3178 stop:3636 length:459 start_codon:yes stop_codon:yes gene_type:complete